MVAVAFVLVACGGGNTNEDNSPEVSETEDVKQLVNDYSAGNIDAKSASITSHQLVVTENDDSKLTYDLPDEEFFVSIAPYVDGTHPWTDHNLTGCQGELADVELDLYIEDTEGNVILDETVKSPANGFLDFWLPRDKTYNVTVEYDGKMVESEISTFEGDDTCITTMQLM